MNDYTKIDTSLYTSSTATLHIPERSEWVCYMFGNTPRTNDGFKWNPIKGKEPNCFVRWMMKICFACTWVKEMNK